MSTSEACHTKNPIRTLVQLVKNKPRNQSHSRKKGARSTRVPRHKTLIPTIHEENSPEKKFYRHFQNSPVKIIMAPTPIIFLQPHRTTPWLPHGANPSKARIHVPIVDRHCSTLVLDTINTIPSKDDHHPLKD